MCLRSGNLRRRCNGSRGRRGNIPGSRHGKSGARLDDIPLFAIFQEIPGRSKGHQRSSHHDKGYLPNTSAIGSSLLILEQFTGNADHPCSGLFLSLLVFQFFQCIKNITHYLDHFPANSQLRIRPHRPLRTESGCASAMNRPIMDGVMLRLSWVQAMTNACSQATLISRGMPWE